MNERRIIALLGRRDEPTDAVEEYCRYLGGALRSYGLAMELARVAWAERGWRVALQELRERASAWRGRWVLLQYTALAWSARGFPWRFLSRLRELCEAGARMAVVYHDVEAYGGGRVDRQGSPPRASASHAPSAADLGPRIFTVPLENISWLGRAHSNAAFIPVGANLPVLAVSRATRSPGDWKR